MGIDSNNQPPGMCFQLLQSNDATLKDGLRLQKRRLGQIDLDRMEILWSEKVGKDDDDA